MYLLLFKFNQIIYFSYSSGKLFWLALSRNLARFVFFLLQFAKVVKGGKNVIQFIFSEIKSYLTQLSILRMFR